jgi:hypothetical protein
VNLTAPCDSDPTARKKRKAKLIEEDRRRGPAVLELHGEVLPVGFNGDGVLDGVQGFKARSKAWSLALVASCNGDEGQLELGDLAGVLWAWRRTASRKGSGKRQSYPGVQVIEASLMVKSAESR